MDKVAVSRAIAGLIAARPFQPQPSTEDARHSRLELTREGEARLPPRSCRLALAEEARLISALSGAERPNSNG